MLVRFLLGLMTMAYCQSSAALEISITHASFNAPSQPYVEVYLYLNGESLLYESTDSLHQQATVEFALSFSQQNHIRLYDKFRLAGPTTRKPIDFMDLKRYSLPSGTYQLEIRAWDVLDTTRQLTHSSVVRCDYTGVGVAQSDIQLLSAVRKSADDPSAFVKNGFFMEPLGFKRYSKKASKLAFYNEVYAAAHKDSGGLVIRYAIERLPDTGVAKIVRIAHKRRAAARVVPLLIQMDISTLPTGNYRLVVELRNAFNQLLSRRTASFSRHNPYLNKSRNDLTEEDLADSFVKTLNDQELRYSLKALAPRITMADVEALNKVIAQEQRLAKESFLLGFFIEINPNNPQQAYYQYMKLARQVDQLYHTGLGYGFETDRGFVHLKYGQPNDVITVEDDPAAPPYEIWSYNNLPSTRQSNIKFLFYNPSLVAGDFQLLHSNAKGEIYNPQWQLELYKSIPEEVIGPNKFDATEVGDGYNRRASRYLIDF